MRFPFMKAAWYLRKQGFVLAGTPLVKKEGRLYRIYHPNSEHPEVFALPAAICALAALQREDLSRHRPFEESKGDSEIPYHPC